MNRKLHTALIFAILYVAALAPALAVAGTYSGTGAHDHCVNKDRDRIHPASEAGFSFTGDTHVVPETSTENNSTTPVESQACSPSVISILCGGDSGSLAILTSVRPMSLALQYEPPHPSQDKNPPRQSL